MIMTLKLRVVLQVAVLGLVLSGCSTEEPGKATPGDTASETTASSSTSSSGNSSIADVDPCSLLKPADVSKLKLSPAEKVDNNSCQWRTQDRTLVRLGIYATLGLKDYVLAPNAEPSDIKVGTREAKLVKKSLTNTGCAVSIGLTTTSRVDVNSTGTKLDVTCAASQSVAEAIEPNLP
ncbi:DUF3558 family protein [Lentzea sp. NPDC055074]